MDETIKQQLTQTLEKTEFSNLGKFIEGKVRDNYVKEDKRFIITTDRISAFDRNLGTIPFKGEVLTSIELLREKLAVKLFETGILYMKMELF